VRKVLISISFVLVILCAPGASVAGVERAVVRTGVHKGFERLVVELPRRVRFGIAKRGAGRVEIQMRGAFSPEKGAAGVSTRHIEVGPFSSRKDAKGVLTTLVLTLSRGARYRQSIRTKPFRIVLDVYPAAPSERSAGARHTLERPKKDLSKAVVKTETGAAIKERLKRMFRTSGVGVTDVAFNNGWRWVYRQEAVERLRHGVEIDKRLEWDIFRSELGITAEGMEETLREADRMAARLEESGEQEKAAIIKGALRLFTKGEDADAFEQRLRKDPELSFAHMGYFYLGGYNEEKGFFPEAAGYYSRITKETSEGALYAAALFRNGRLRFFEGRMGKAMDLLRRALRAGSPDAAVWLANTLLVKGETTRASRIFSEKGDAAGAVYSDPITALSMGDNYVVRHDYDAARKVFEGLLKRYAMDEFLSAFFKLKLGDVHLAAGDMTGAVKTYSEVKHMTHDEQWAMASLALADALGIKGDESSLEQAEDIYKRVIEGGFKGAEVAHYSLANVLIMLARYEQAMDVIEGFPSLYPTSRIRDDVMRLSGPLVYNWIDRLYEEGDYHAVANIYVRYGRRIPFGGKAESRLRSGRSLYAAGLFPDAVSNLDRVVKSSRGPVAEEAMLTLARVYLSQGDAGSAERLMKNFSQRFGAESHRGEVDEIMLRAAWLKGDYAGVVARGGVRRTREILLLRAHSLRKLGRYAEAVLAYESAAEEPAGPGGASDLVEIYIGMADSYYDLKKYPLAIDNYNAAVSKMRARDDTNRSWALYRIARSHAALGDAAAESNALGRLRKLDSKLGAWSATIFRKVPEEFISSLDLKGAGAGRSAGRAVQ